MLRLGDCDLAISGGVSENSTPSAFAGFHSQGAWSATTTRREHRGRSTSTATASWWPKEGACSCWNGSATLAGRAKIYGEIAGYAMNSDATDFVLPDPGRQADCIRLALRRAH